MRRSRVGGKGVDGWHGGHQRCGTDRCGRTSRGKSVGREGGHAGFLWHLGIGGGGGGPFACPLGSKCQERP